MTDKILHDKELSNSAYSHIINAPIEKVDIAAWLFKLPEAEFVRCNPRDHISCGTTSTDDGSPMSINVEMLGKALMIHHYVVEVATPSLCRMVSISDAFTPVGRTRVEVIWTLSAKRIDERTCQFTNTLIIHPTAEFMEYVAQHHVTYANVAAARQSVHEQHHHHETPLFAASIERQALSRVQHATA